MPILKVPALEISKGLGPKLTRNPLKTYSIKYVTREIVRPLLKQTLEIVKVSCCAEWDKEEKQWQGKVNYKGKYYQWILKKG